MTEKKLIATLSHMRAIKPNEEWVFYVKQQLFAKKAPTVPLKNDFLGMFSLVLNVLLQKQKRMAYAFAVFLFIAAGVFGFVQYTTLPPDALFGIKKNTEQIQVVLSAESELKNRVETFKKRSQDLVLVVKKQKDVLLAIQEVKDAAQTLTQAIEKDPALAKEIALEVKNNGTFLSVIQNDELQETSKSLYKAIVIPLTEELENKLEKTEKEQELLDKVKELSGEEKYQDALEMLLVNQ